jgi:hypothetical protein
VQSKHLHSALDHAAAARLPADSNADEQATGLDDPRAVDILTTEHWSLLSTRQLGYQEMFGRATLFTGILSATVVALPLIAQATHFGRATLPIAAFLFAVTLLIGIATFARGVVVNFEDARCVAGMNLLRKAYLEIVPELEPYFISGHDPAEAQKALGHGGAQRLANLTQSLTTTSGVIGALNSLLAGALVSALVAVGRANVVVSVAAGTAVSLVSAVLHVRHAARYRRAHAPAAPAQSKGQ